MERPFTKSSSLLYFFFTLWFSQNKKLVDDTFDTCRFIFVHDPRGSSSSSPELLKKKRRERDRQVVKLVVPL